jgi:hypothetical protein
MSDRLYTDPDFYADVQKLKLCIALWIALYLLLTGQL